MWFRSSSEKMSVRNVTEFFQVSIIRRAIVRRKLCSKQLARPSCGCVDNSSSKSRPVSVSDQKGIGSRQVTEHGLSRAQAGSRGKPERCWCFTKTKSILQITPFPRLPSFPVWIEAALGRVFSLISSTNFQNVQTRSQQADCHGSESRSCKSYHRRLSQTCAVHLI